MKWLVAAALFVLSFTTGFTCSKNTPEATKNEAPATSEQSGNQPSQEQMAQPTATSEGAGSGTAAPTNTEQSNPGETTPQGETK